MLKYETKWKWTDTPDSWRGQSGNGQTLQTVEGDKVEMDRHSRQSKGTKWKCTDTPDSRRGQSGNGQTFQTVEGDKVEMDRHSRQSEGTKWKWTDTPDSRRGQSWNGQTLSCYGVMLPKWIKSTNLQRAITQALRDLIKKHMKGDK